MTGEAQAESLVALCHELAGRGLGSSTSGNCSLRTSGGILVTSTGVSMSETTVENLSLLDPDTGKPTGSNRPSKDWRLHVAAHRGTEDELATVVHVHPAYSIAVGNRLWARGHRIVPAATPQFVMRCGWVPLIPYAHPGSEELAAAVATGFTGPAAILVNHGVVVRGAAPRAALGVLEELEENSRIALLQGEEAAVLSEDLVAELMKMKM